MGYTVIMIDENKQNTLLNSAIKQLLKPLMRFLINKQITLPTLLEVIKSAYVEVAEKDFTIADKPATDSRINLLTGVHRKDVKRLRDQNLEHKPSERLSINSLMLASWMGEEPYCINGIPQPLMISGEGSFESLANEYSRQNIHSSSIMESWLQMGWIDKDEALTLHLNMDTLQDKQLTEDQLYFFSENLADHMATSTGNLVNKQKNFERAVFYNKLSKASLSILKKSAKDQSMQVLKDLNQQALALQKKDKATSGPHYRFRLGSYIYTDLDDE
jgi:hypothetical protein